MTGRRSAWRRWMAGPLMLGAGSALAGCLIGPTVSAPQLDPAAVPRRTVAVALQDGPGFPDYTHPVFDGLELRVGPAATRMFVRVLGAAFSRVDRVGARAQAPFGDDVQAVIRPEILWVYVPGDAPDDPLAALRFRVEWRRPGGPPITTWTLTGRGEPRGLQARFHPAASAMAAALADVQRQLVARLGSDRELAGALGEVLRPDP